MILNQLNFILESRKKKPCNVVARKDIEIAKVVDFCPHGDNHEPGRMKKGKSTMMEISLRFKMDRANKVKNFRDIGMTDPFVGKVAIEDAISIVKTFDFYTYVYPEKVMA